MKNTVDKIDINEINNLYHMFCQRIHRSAEKIAYQYYDEDKNSWQTLTWSQMADHVARWQHALSDENLGPGDRVAIMIDNCPEWVMFEQAALGLGLVVVPLYTNDRADNISYIIDDANIKLLLIQGEDHWTQLQDHLKHIASFQKTICMEPLPQYDDAVIHVNKWLPDITRRFPLAELNVHESSLATIVYTSGTTGKPKGVMLSHHNILWNADSGSDSVRVFADDTFLSFLPLSHMLERTAGHYLPMLCGSTVSYARSIEKLAEDLVTIGPTVLITVPRIFERVYNKIHTQLKEKSSIARFLFNSTVNVGWHRFLMRQEKASWHPSLIIWPLLHLLVGKKIMAKLGGNMRLAVSGGAPLNASVAKTFIGLGLSISQGYGMTELSPVVSTNKLEDNEPESVGQPLRDVNVMLAENDELCVRSPGVMLGYWNNEVATKEIIDDDGWLHTGDVAKIINNHIYITGRIKEILVLSNGEKVPPADLEMAIAKDTLFEQTMIIGESRPFLSALLVFNKDEWKKIASDLDIEATEDNLNSETVKQHALTRIQHQLHDFPGYARIYQIKITLEPWTVENGMLTPTLKLKRNVILDHYSNDVEEFYKGH